MAHIPLRTRLFAVLAAVSLAGCTNTEFVERPLFNTPTDAVNGFLGYQNAATKKTSCGNCHVGTQAQWRADTVGHPVAWAGLQKAGAAVNNTCYGCHALGANGNQVTAATAGLQSPSDSNYRDVQCEACHGPGLTHVTNPEVRANLPLARANITTGYNTTTGEELALDTDASCASCHGVAHGPSLAEEWAISRHGRIQVGVLARPECLSCHNGKETIRWLGGGQTPNYRELTNTTAGQQAAFPITCTACHDPHGSENPGNLRAPINTPDLSRNLCMQCHNRSATPSRSFTSGSRGAHSAQGPIVAGFGFGYIPAGFAFDSASPAATSHNSTNNPRLCAGCHVVSFTVNDPQAGQLKYNGHRFLANPCVGSNGLPTTAQDCPETTAARNWTSCLGSGCHATQEAARSSFVSNAATNQALVDIIFRNLNGNVSSSGSAIVDAAPIDGGYLARIRAAAPTEFTNANVLTAAEGALFNLYALADDMFPHKDGSKGAHNPAFYSALLAATAADLLARYPSILTATEAERALIERELNKPYVRYTPPAPIQGLNLISSR
ncbi:MAG: cytochrome c3 family protein [Gemmatimonadales bacterium]|nr:cytochrome c3 family protein [Gemmatimonadales bacterium]